MVPILLLPSHREQPPDPANAKLPPRLPPPKGGIDIECVRCGAKKKKRKKEKSSRNRGKPGVARHCTTLRHRRRRADRSTHTGGGGQSVPLRASAARRRSWSWSWLLRGRRPVRGRGIPRGAPWAPGRAQGRTPGSPLRPRGAVGRRGAGSPGRIPRWPDCRGQVLCRRRGAHDSGAERPRSATATTALDHSNYYTPHVTEEGCRRQLQDREKKKEENKA